MIPVFLSLALPGGITDPGYNGRARLRSTSHDPPEILECIQSRVMPVAPARLESVAAHDLPTRQLEACRHIGHVRARNVAQHIRFTTAQSAWTGAAKSFQRQVGFHTVSPANGELVPNQLHIFQFESHEKG